MKRYKKDADNSFALGATLTFELLKHKPNEALKIWLSPNLSKNENTEKLLNLARSLGIETEENAKIFNILSPKDNCYVIGEFRKFGSTLSPTAPHILLDAPSGCGNVGTILRTALGLGYENIALIPPCVDIFAPETVRASMGAIFALSVKVFDSIEAYRAAFPKHNLYPFMLSASKPIDEVVFNGPFTLAFGNEAHGLPDSYAALGQSVIIPCTDKVDSLNLSIAAAIGMYKAKANSELRIKN